MTFSKGDSVSWSWGKGTADGMVKKQYTQKITLELKGAEVTRNATPDEPAYLIEQEDGSEVLKLGSELD